MHDQATPDVGISNSRFAVTAERWQIPSIYKKQLKARKEPVADPIRSCSTPQIRAVAALLQQRKAAACAEV